MSQRFQTLRCCSERVNVELLRFSGFVHCNHFLPLKCIGLFRYVNTCFWSNLQFPGDLLTGGPESGLLTRVLFPFVGCNRKESGAVVSNNPKELPLFHTAKTRNAIGLLQHQGRIWPAKVIQNGNPYAVGALARHLPKKSRFVDHRCGCKAGQTEKTGCFIKTSEHRNIMIVK